MKSVHPLFSWNFYGIISISFYGRRGLYSTINKTDAFVAPGCCLLTGGMTMDFKNKKTTIALIVCAVILALIGWRVWANIQAKKAEANRSGKEKVAVVTAAYPERKTIVPKFRFSGTLDPVWQADVAAKVDGRIEQVLVNEGDAVSAGEVLAILDRTDTDASLLNAKGLYADAKTDYEKAQADLARYTKLYAAGAISKESLDNKQFALENAKGKLDAAQGNLNSADSQAGGTRVTTPRPGIIQKRYYQEGYYAKVGTALFQIADISTLLAKIDVPEGYVQSIAVGNPVEIHIPSMSGDNKTVQGIVTRISPVATLPARTFEAEVSVDNSDGRLRGGVYADTTLTANPKDNALTIPMSAIVMRDDQRTVYVIEDGRAVRKVITTGYIGENLVEVLSGLSEKDQVITGGQNKFKEGGQVKVSGEG